MIKDALAYLMELARPPIVTVGEGQYSTFGLTPVIAPTHASIGVSTLQGIVDFLNDGIDGLTTNDLMIVIKSPSNVDLVSKAQHPHLNRGLIMSSKLEYKPFAFGVEQESEDFIVALQSLFTDKADYLKLLKLAGGVSDVKELAISDDGISQDVTMKAGIVRREPATVKNPFVLAPRRSFPEIEQVESNFVLRIEGQENNISFTLYEADGGAWMIEAKARIKTWLQAQLKDYSIIA